MGAVIDPMDAMHQAASGETGSDFSPSGWVFAPGSANMIVSGQVSATAFSPNCAGMPAPNLNLFQTATGLALGTTAAGVGILGVTHVIAAAAIPVIGAVIAGVGAAIMVIDQIFAHHSAAVRQEQQLGCAAIAAGNNAIAIIDQAVRSGQLKPSDAAAAMDTVVSKIAAMMAPSIKHGPCNADCEVLVQFKAIGIYRKSLYQSLTASQTSSATSALPATGGGGTAVPTGFNPGGGGTIVPMNTSTGGGAQVDLATGAVVQPSPPTNTPSWLPLAAAIAFAFVVLK